MIHVENISFEYREPKTKRQILDNISIDIHPGESIAVLGPNGSGKTTFARCLNGLLSPTKGSIQIDGLDTRDENNLQHIRRKVGMVFQNPDNQIVSATVEREIAFGLENLGLPSAEMQTLVEEVLVQFKLKPYRHNSPHYLSGGEKQRLALASVMAMRPKYLVLDEPTSLLDPTSRKEILGVVKGLGARTDSIATILITQFAEEALQANRVIIFDRGQIVLDGRPDSIFKNYRTLRTIGLEPPVKFILDDILGQYIR